MHTKWDVGTSLNKKLTQGSKNNSFNLDNEITIATQFHHSHDTCSMKWFITKGTFMSIFNNYENFEIYNRVFNKLPKLYQTYDNWTATFKKTYEKMYSSITVILFCLYWTSISHNKHDRHMEHIVECVTY